MTRLAHPQARALRGVLLWVPILCSIAPIALATHPEITQILDFSGDGAGNSLLMPRPIALDPAGNLFVAGVFSDNVFRIAPNGLTTEIIDATGDGLGNPLLEPKGIAVDAGGTVYVRATTPTTHSGSHPLASSRRSSTRQATARGTRSRSPAPSLSAQTATSSSPGASRTTSSVSRPAVSSRRSSTRAETARAIHS